MNNRNGIIKLILLMFLFSAGSLTFAIEPLPPDIHQFQDWLQKNKGAIRAEAQASSGVQPETNRAETQVAPTVNALPAGAFPTSPTPTNNPVTVGASPAGAPTSPPPTESSVSVVSSESASAANTFPVAIPAEQMTNASNLTTPTTEKSYDSHSVMLRAAPPFPLQPDPDSDAAFDVMMHQNMPLTPEQIVKLHQLIDTSQRAASIPANVPPKPVSTTVMINLAPGSTPPAVRLAVGYVSSLVFVDSTGTPWPIASFDVGDPKSMNLEWDGKSNVLLIQPKSPYGDSNMVVRLVGLPTPITLQLVSGQRVVDYRVDLHVSGIGPNTKELPMGTPLPNSANQVLLGVLDGVAPPGSKALRVIGGDCQAWSAGDHMYLRTRMTVLSPGWTGRMVSSDGMIAYEMQSSSSVLVSQYGNPIELKLEGM